MLKFCINEVCPALDAWIRLIHTKVFDDKEIAEYQPDWKAQEANAVECYNLAIDEDDDLHNINIRRTLRSPWTSSRSTRSDSALEDKASKHWVRRNA